MSGQPAAADGFTCSNCDTTGLGEFCGHCGQKRSRPGDLSLAHAWHHLVDELLDVDSRIFRTLRVLFTQPGQLTLDYLAGRRARYVHPLRLFLVVSGIYFLAEAQTLSPSRVLHGSPGAEARAALRSQAAAGGESYQARLAQVDERMHLVFKVTFIATVAINGLVLWAIFRRARPYLAEHMVTALHLSALTMIVTAASSALARWFHGEAWMGGVVATLMQFYTARALQRVYPGHTRGLVAAVVTLVLVDVGVLVAASIITLRLASGLPLV
jgi:hypothetical protein